MAALLLLPWVRNLLVIVGVLAFACTAWYTVTSYYERKGATERQAEITRDNDVARKRADEGQYAPGRCADRGGEWDRARGVCVDKPGR